MTRGQQIRVLVLVEHRMVREGLSIVLDEDPGLQLIRAVADPTEIAAACRSGPPDVVVVDLEYSGFEGKQIARELRENCPQARVVGVSESDQPNLAVRAIELGLSAIYVKTEPSEELVSLVKRAGAGETVVPSPRASGGPVGEKAEQLAGRLVLDRLTPREREVLQNLAEGRGTAQVARQLAISPLTVQSHVKSILEKLGVHSKIEAVTMAFRHGLVRIPGARASGQNS